MKEFTIIWGFTVIHQSLYFLSFLFLCSRMYNKKMNLKLSQQKNFKDKTFISKSKFIKLLEKNIIRRSFLHSYYSSAIKYLWLIYDIFDLIRQHSVPIWIISFPSRQLEDVSFNDS